MAEPGSRNNARLTLIITIVAALLLIACLAGITGIVLWGRSIAHDDTRQTVGVGEAALDGNFEFRVHQIRCGIEKLGDEYVSQVAFGQFCLVEIAIRNIGDRPAIFSDELQRAYGPTGEEYATDSGAGILVNPSQQMFLNELDPGNEVVGVVVYDIPPETRITRLQLREQESSTGVAVLVE